MDFLRVVVWRSLADRTWRDLHVHDLVDGFFWQRDPPLEPHVKDKRFRDVHERFWADPSPEATFAAPQTTPQSVLLRHDIAAQCNS